MSVLNYYSDFVCCRLDGDVEVWSKPLKDDRVAVSYCSQYLKLCS